MPILRTPILLALLLAFAGVVSAQTQPTVKDKKLIEFGWDEPDTVFMRKHIEQMEKTPFDGTVFHLTHDFLWGNWSKRVFTEADLSKAAEDLKHTPIKKFTHNFLRFNVTPGDVDWFDDFAPIINNARLAAKIAREGMAAGILFDIEQYNSPLFTHAKQRDAATKSFDVYAAKVRERGREVMQAFQQEFPDLKVLLTFGYSLPMSQAGADKSKLAQASYGLLAPLLDGMFETASGKSVIIDGFEISYGYKEPRQFDEARVTMKQNVLPLISPVEKYKQHGQLSFGLWMDYDWRNKAWDANDISKNHFKPDEFEKSVRKALETADEYVWIYTEKPRWWTDAGTSTELPAAYQQAVRRAREQGN